MTRAKEHGKTFCKTIAGLAATALFSILPLWSVAFAGFSKATDVIDVAGVNEDKVGKILYPNRVYTINKSGTIDFSGEVASPLKVSSGTTVLFLDKGQTLEVIGSNADEANGGYPGILVGSGSTLVVTGEGKLIAKGGNGYKGENGQNGSNAKMNYDHTTAGNGGDGGDGGAGAGAGIGGNGGRGGVGGVHGEDEPQVSTENSSSYDHDGANGNNGTNGKAGSGAGSIYLLGKMDLKSTGGAVGAGGSKGSTGGGRKETWARSYSAGGGGGGGGGAGGAAASGIGGGGGGGGGGGAGGNGGRRWTTATTSDRHPTGAGGEKGYDNGEGHDRTARQYFEDATDSDRSWGGYGGYGGSKGASGGLEGFYRDSTYTTFDGTVSSTTSVSSHSAIEYSLILDVAYRNGPSAKFLPSKLGYPLPTSTDGVYKPVRSGYIFIGWHENENGGGECYYDRYLTPSISSYHYIGNKRIYAYWTKDRDVVWVNGTGITAGHSKSGDGWTYDADASTLSLTGQDRTFLIWGEDEFGEITINVAKNCNVIASNLTVNAELHAERSAFRVAQGVTARLTLQGDNIFRGGDGAPALRVENGETLVIDGDGTLEATTGIVDEMETGSPAAAIGSRSGKDAGSITVKGGTINASSGGGAGIGGGAGGSDGALSVLGGYVVATGGRHDDDDTGETLFSSDIGPGCGYTSTSYSVKSTIDPSKAYLVPYNFRLACSETDIGPSFHNKDNLPLYCVAFTGLVANATAEFKGVPEGYLPPFEIKTTGNGAVYLWLPNATEKYDIEITADGKTIRYIVQVNGEHVVAPFAAGLRVNGRDILLGYGAGWSLDESSNLVKLIGEGIFTIDGSAPSYGLEVRKSCSVILSNAVIRASGRVNKSGLRLADGVSVDLTLIGSNTLQGGTYFAGLEVGSGRRVTIGGSGSLVAQGASGGAGIGGSTGSPDWGRIYITGGTITAKGSRYTDGIGSAGIGAGPGGSGGTILITGGDISATGGPCGAGIGAGSAKWTNQVETASWSLPGIEISGDDTIVSAVGGLYAAGIGGGDGMSGGNVKILGGTVNAVGGGPANEVDRGRGAGIGGGRNGDGGSIAISGGSVTAEGSAGAAGIGGGYKGKAGTIRISKGKVKATAGEQAAGIGVGASAEGGSIYIESGTVTSTGGQNGGNSIGTAFASTETTGLIEITGGAVNAEYVYALPVNASSERVYRLQIECNVGGLLVTNLHLSTAPYYKFDGAYTDGKGILNVWIPASGNGVYPGLVALEDGTSVDFYYAVTDGGQTYYGYIIFANGEEVFSAIDMTGTGWTYTRADHALKFDDADIPVTVSGNSRAGAFKIVVPQGGATNVTFDDFSIVSSEKNQFDSPVVISNRCTLALLGKNLAKGAAPYSAGIEVVEGAELTILGHGELEAYGGRYAAGIGSPGSNSKTYSLPGRIVMTSGIVHATGGDNAAGLGGGSGCNLGENGILIQGGRLYAHGGKNAAGVGAGYGQLVIPDGAVSITGGTVAAYGDRSNPSTTGLSSSKSQSDFVASVGNSVDTTHADYKPLVITGGSSVPEVVGAAIPNPVGPDGKRVRSILLVGFEPDEPVTIYSEDLPDYYSTDDIYADPEGKVCLWLYPTNHARLIKANDMEFETPYPYANQLSQPIYYADVVVTGRTVNVTGSSYVAEEEPLLTNLDVGSGYVSLTLPLSAVRTLIASPKKALFAAKSVPAGTVKIYASTSLPFPEPPEEIDLNDASHCTITPNDDGETATVTIRLDGDAPQMFYRIEHW